MSNTLFPTSIDNPTDPTSSNTLNNPPHHLQHGFANDAIVAIENVLGITGSAVAGTVSYVLGGVTSGDKAVSKTGTETLTNKSLSTGTTVALGSDATGDIYYRNSGGVLARLPIGSSLQILSVSGSSLPSWIANPSAATGSTTVAGIFQGATQAAADAGTATGSTGAANVITADVNRAKLVNSGVVDTGSANAYAIAPTPAITAYASYQQFSFKAVNANTGASTLNVNGLGTKNIYKNGTNALNSGDIAAGQMILVEYDGTQFQLLNPVANAGALVARGYIAITSAGGTSSPTLTFLPKYIRITCSCPGGNASVYEANISFGGWDSVAGNNCMTNQGTSDVSHCLSVINSSSSASTGTVGSVTATGFTLTVTSGVATQTYWEAFG